MAHPDKRSAGPIVWLAIILLAIAAAAWFMMKPQSNVGTMPAPAASTEAPPPGFEEEPKGPKVDVTLPAEGYKGTEAARPPGAQPAP